MGDEVLRESKQFETAETQNTERQSNCSLIDGFLGKFKEASNIKEKKEMEKAMCENFKETFSQKGNFWNMIGEFFKDPKETINKVHNACQEVERNVKKNKKEQENVKSEEKA